MAKIPVTFEQLMEQLNRLAETANGIKAERDAAKALNAELLKALERLSAFAEQMFASFAPVEQEELRPDLELAEAAIRKSKDSALQEILPEKNEA